MSLHLYPIHHFHPYQIFWIVIDIGWHIYWLHLFFLMNQIFFLNFFVSQLQFILSLIFLVLYPQLFKNILWKLLKLLFRQGMIKLIKISFRLIMGEFYIQIVTGNTIDHLRSYNLSYPYRMLLRLFKLYYQISSHIWKLYSSTSNTYIFYNI